MAKFYFATPQLHIFSNPKTHFHLFFFLNPKHHQPRFFFPKTPSFSELMVAVASPILLPVIHASWVAVAIVPRYGDRIFSGWQGDMRKVGYHLHPGRLTAGTYSHHQFRNPTNHQFLFEIKIIFQTSMIMFHVIFSWVYPKWMIWFIDCEGMSR